MRNARTKSCLPARELEQCGYICEYDMSGEGNFIGFKVRVEISISSLFTRILFLQLSINKYQPRRSHLHHSGVFEGWENMKTLFLSSELFLRTMNHENREKCRPKRSRTEERNNKKWQVHSEYKFPFDTVVGQLERKFWWWEKRVESFPFSRRRYNGPSIARKGRKLLGKK